MAFLESLSSGIICGEEIAYCPYRFSVCGEKGGYFEGIKSIVSYDKNIVVLSYGRGKITVKGKNLSIDKLFGKDVKLGGVIISVTVEKL